MNLSFAGCGFLGIYHVGVAVAFKKYAPHLLLEKIGGASAGALAATCLLCNMPLGELTSDFFRVVNEARSHSLKAFSPSFNIQNCLLEGLEKFLPPNAHELVNGKLHISLTRFWGRKNVIVSHFDSREELLQALLCACWIPVFSGYIPPKFRGVSYMDGAFSDNLPVLDENTITVSPFCGESDICPRDDSAQLFHVNLANTSIEVSMENMGRLRRILVPCLPEELSDMCQQGFDDALQFLHRNYLISCTRCLAVQSTFVVQETVHDPRKKHFDPKCMECVRHRTEALDGNKMPETVLTVFQTYIESANIGLAKWIFRNRGWRLLETLSLPATVPADMICATLTKLLLMTNNLISMVGDSVERRDLEMWVVANYINQSQPVLPLHSHRHRYVEEVDVEEVVGTDAEPMATAVLRLWLRRLSRLLATTPCIRERFWHVADFLIDQINALNSIVQSQRTEQKLTANISCQLSLTECGKQRKKSTALTHRSSKLDILINDNEIVSTLDRQQPQAKHTKTGAALAAVAADNSDCDEDDEQLNEADKHNNHHHHHHHGDVDSFDHILQTTSHQEAVYAYYYMDADHKVKVTEIFDMTDNEDPDLQTINERTLNQQLQFDATEWDARTPADHLYAESPVGGHRHHQHEHRQQQPLSSESNSSTGRRRSGQLFRTKPGVNSGQHPLYDELLDSAAHKYTPDAVHLVQTYRSTPNDATYSHSRRPLNAPQHSLPLYDDDDQHSVDSSFTFDMDLDDDDVYNFRGRGQPSAPLSGISSPSIDNNDAGGLLRINDDDDDDDDVDRLSPSNSSEPEVDQSMAAATATSAAASVVSERASRALQRTSMRHFML